MTDDELDRLADLIARALLDHRPDNATAPRRTWLPTPVRPAPPQRGAEPPVWAGAAQELLDVAPSGGEGRQPKFRPSTGELTRATRAAAAGKAPPPERAAREGKSRLTRQRARGAPAIDIRVGVSNRHVHLSADHVRTLFGAASLSSARELTQPGQFAANETVHVVGPKGRIDGVRIVGPMRAETQLELARSDATVLGVEPPVAASGSLDGSIGGVTLVGPVGSVDLARGVIIAARHLHLSPADSRRWGLGNGDRVDVRCGVGARAVTFHGVLVRSGGGHATELHLDADEARAAGVRSADVGSVVAWHRPTDARRPLVTERDVLEIARRGDRVPVNAILTPSARDRAASLGLLDR